MRHRSFRAAPGALALILFAFGCATESPGPAGNTVAPPLLSPEPATYSSAIDVVLTTATPGAAIRYTTDGTTPTETAGIVVAGPVRVAETLTLRAVAYRDGWTTSSVSSGLYTIAPLVAAPVFSPGPGTFFAAQEVAITTATPDATIRYTTDGTTPTTAHGAVYAGPVSVAATSVLKAVAYRTGWTTSRVASGQYVIGPAVEAPVFSPGPGAYSGPQDIVIATLTAGASIRATTDGSEPTETAGTLYAAPVRLEASATLRAVAYRSGWTTSPVTSGDYAIALYVAAPSFSPPGGAYEEAQDVALATSTPGASIRYTVDRSTPTTAHGTVYAAPVRVEETLTLKAVAYRTGWVTSGVTSALYAIEPPEPAYKQYLYAANSESHSVSAFAIDPGTGALAPVAGSPFACAGTHPWSVAAHPAGSFLYVLDYASRDISIFAVHPATGALAATGASPCPTGGASPSWIVVEPTGRFLYAADSSLNGIRGFAIDAATGALAPFAGPLVAAGVSPVSLAVEPAGKFLYAANAGSHDVSAFAVDAATGALAAVAGSPFAAGGTSPTTVGAHPSGPFLYVANGASDNISAFAVDPASGALTAVAGSPFAAGGAAPMAVAVDPAGRFAYAANAGSTTLSGFSVDGATGGLAAVPGSPFAAGGAYPRAVAFDAAGRFAYVANAYSNAVAAFAIDAATGALAPLAGSPFVAGTGPYALVAVRVAQ